MSQRNPMNERYTSEERSGTTRKSAASAKPKTKAAASVVIQPTEKSAQQKKADAKAARKKAEAEQRELDRKYYKPDTPEYKKLRRIWIVCLVGAVLATALSWFGRSIEPGWISMVALFAAYALIIAAFYIDFSKIRKERRKYQDRMVALEEKQKKEARAAARIEQQKQQQKKGSGKNQNRNAKPKASAKDAAQEEAASDSPVEEARPGLFGGLFGKGKVRAEKERVQAAQKAAAESSAATKSKSSKPEK